MSKQGRLFSTKVVPGKPGSGNLIDEEIRYNNEPVKCLGLEFENDDNRLAHYTELLRQKLKDPEFCKIEGFPVGEDEDIIKLSDPPYYTVCPNPWISDFIDEWENQKPEKPTDYIYHREPFASDVKEGKNDPIYNAHSYHTKVPHKAIMHHILHYTEPGDIVFDGFCGTGMTGVAAQMCGDKDVVESLGYKVKRNGTILQEEIDGSGKKIWKPISKLGARKAVLNDLSPAATFIAYNYNTPVNTKVFVEEYKKLISELKKATCWMWETLHSDGKTKGKINYIVWSDVYNCPECLKPFTYYNEAFKKNAEKVKFTPEFNCPHCNCLISKKPSKLSLAQKPNRTFENYYDPISLEVKHKQKQIPVLLNYSVGTKRFEKLVDSKEIQKLERLNSEEIPKDFVPIASIIEGDKSADPISFGVRQIHQFFSNRILHSLSKLTELSGNNPQLFFLIGSALPKLTIMNRYMPQHGSRALVGPMANTLYVPPVNVENNIIDQIEFQFKKIVKALTTLEGSTISTSAAQNLKIPEASIDYIFLDPPFGANIMYSELNYIREAWLRVFTNNKPEAIENKTQKKDIEEYRKLMTECFVAAFKFLKPGRWMTVEFSNTKASVWNSIQYALSDAGFIVASVAALDKTRGGLHAMIGPTAVKQDLVISAYKPNGGFVNRFTHKANTEEGVWDFIRAHLKYLPVTKKQGVDFVTITERDPRILYDQVIAYFVRNGYNIPIDSQEFQLGLSQRFSERDGMYFLPEQVVEYDRKKMIDGGKPPLLSLFISDEATAIEWLRCLLRDKPQSFQDINPLFMKEIIGSWKKNEVGMELHTLLEQNFLFYNGIGPVPEQIHSYLSSNWKNMRNLPKIDLTLVAKAKGRWYVPDPNKAGDLEKLREKALLKEFEEYKQIKKTLKIFRLEAIRTGFKKAWQERNYKVIIKIAEKIPKNVLEEDPKLFLWYDQALTRIGDE